MCDSPVAERYRETRDNTTTAHRRSLSLSFCAEEEEEEVERGVTAAAVAAAAAAAATAAAAAAVGERAIIARARASGAERSGMKRIVIGAWGARARARAHAKFTAMEIELSRGWHAPEGCRCMGMYVYGRRAAMVAPMEYRDGGLARL